MEVLKNLLINYWPQILAVIIFIASFILQCFKKKPINDIDSLIYKLSIFGIRLAEASDKKGKDKLDTAVNYVCMLLNHTYPKLDTSRYVKFISSCIEEILTTPQKKNER